MTSRRGEGSFFGNVDWVTVIIYTVLVFCGWLSIYAAVYDDSHSSILDLSQRYGMQVLWIGMSFFLAVSILLIDAKYYHILAYPLYVASLVILIGVALFGATVNNAKAWIMIGSVGIQPTELVKVTTSLAVARFMSSYSFDIHRFRDLFWAAVIIAVPAFIIAVPQNDMGSALVYASLLFMFYREGLNGWLYVTLIMAVSLFVLSFILEPVALLALMILACAAAEGILNGRWKSKAVYIAAVALTAGAIYCVNLIPGVSLSVYAALLITAALSLGWVVSYAYRYKLRNVFVFVLLFIGSLLFVYMVDYAFDKFQPHQQERILNVLGLETDDKGSSYNVNQSKIAIGSGGIIGKGFLEGTQTKFNFVPEQSTDFIFCTVGEEWGFVGTSFVMVLFAVLVFRLMRMGERQAEPFGRIYCYCAASIFLFHVVINIGMTIGIIPVIGIPLPFFSYGGSSMLAFTMLLFIAVKLDASRSEIKISL